MRSLWFALRKTNLRLIPPVADCLFRQQCDASGAVMLETWLQDLARFTFDFLV
jgi:hypothetical protein